MTSQKKASIVKKTIKQRLKDPPVKRLKSRAERIFYKLGVRSINFGSMPFLEGIIKNREASIRGWLQLIENPAVNRKKKYREIINSMNSLNSLLNYHAQGFKKTSFNKVYEKIVSIGNKNNIGIISNIKSGMGSKHCVINSNFFDSALNKLIKLNPKLINFSFSEKKMLLTFTFDKTKKIPSEATDFIIASGGKYFTETKNGFNFLFSIPVI